MSIIFPPVASRAIRIVNDQAVVGPAGQKCVLYRFEGFREQEDQINTDQERIRQQAQAMYRQAREEPSNSVYSDPIPTKVYIDWKETRSVLYEAKNKGQLDVDNPILHFQDNVPIMARFKFEDYVTRGSYIKTPVMLPRTNDTYDASSERNLIERLRVNGLVPKGQENVADIEYQLGIVRGMEEQAESDNDKMDDIPANFFEV